MATKVTGTDRKTGKPTTMTFGTRAVAESYARSSMRGATFEDTDAAVETKVTACPVATAELQRAVTRAYYAPVDEARRGKVIEPERITSEQFAEMQMEHFADARAAGQSMEDACRDWDHVQARL